MEWPPSAPSSEATLPVALIRSTSAAVSASSRLSGYRRISSCTRSICSRVVVTAVSPSRSADTYTDQNWAPTPPRAIRGQSVWIAGTGPARSVVSTSTSGATRSVHGRSLWPSRIGERVSRSRAASRELLVIASAYGSRWMFWRSGPGHLLSFGCPTLVHAQPDQRDRQAGQGDRGQATADHV